MNLEYYPQDSRIKLVEEDVAQTLNSRAGTGGVTYRLLSKSMKTVTLTGHSEYKESTIGGTLRSTFGDVEGGSETLVIHDI